MTARAYGRQNKKSCHQTGGNHPETAVSGARDLLEQKLCMQSRTDLIWVTLDCCFHQRGVLCLCLLKVLTTACSTTRFFPSLFPHPLSGILFIVTWWYPPMLPANLSIYYPTWSESWNITGSHFMTDSFLDISCPFFQSCVLPIIPSLLYTFQKEWPWNTSMGFQNIVKTCKHQLYLLRGICADWVAMILPESSIFKRVD